MVPELGHFALILALCVALLLGVLPFVGAATGNIVWIGLARPAAWVQFFLVAFAFGCLTYAFIANDFSVLYVTQHSNTHLPLIYRWSAVWGGHEGSMLLWVLMLSGWTMAVATLSRTLPDAMVARVLGVLGLVSSGFLLFILLTSNPFARLLPAAEEGGDLNPVLQDPGLVFHPPLLYMGYVGFSVAFAFAIAALMAGRLDAVWARWSRPWTLAAWLFLTLGIALGSRWAYYELGWGGWWFWDSVENASFMPWLAGTALVHSLAVTDKRGSFKNWTVLLAIGAFSLSLVGTFVVRSGVLTSVHAFATDPRRGVFILLLLGVVIGGSLLLYALRAPKVSLGGRFALVSRETLLLMNSVLLVVACTTVFLGTFYPLFIDALGLGKLSVGPPYFNTVFLPIMVPVLILVAFGPIARWKQADLKDMLRRLRTPFAVALLAGLVLPFAMGRWSAAAALGIALATWIAGSVAAGIATRVRNARQLGMSLGDALARQPRSWYGMHLAHFGLAVVAVGITLVKNYETEKDVRMDPGDTVSVGGYSIKFLGAQQAMGPNYKAAVGDMVLSKEGRVLRQLHPEKRTYFSSDEPMTEAAIDAGFTRDVYVSLGEPLAGGAWSMRVYHKPFVDWIWVGALFMACGGTLAASDRRYRMKSGLARGQDAVAGAAS